MSVPGFVWWDVILGIVTLADISKFLLDRDRSVGFSASRNPPSTGPDRRGVFWKSSRGTEACLEEQPVASHPSPASGHAEIQCTPPARPCGAFAVIEHGLRLDGADLLRIAGARFQGPCSGAVFVIGTFPYVDLVAAMMSSAVTLVRAIQVTSSVRTSRPGQSVHPGTSALGSIARSGPASGPDPSVVVPPGVRVALDTHQDRQQMSRSWTWNLEQAATRSGRARWMSSGRAESQGVYMPLGLLCGWNPPGHRFLDIT